MATVRARQQEQHEEAVKLREKEEARKQKKETVGRAFARIDDEKKRKKAAGSDRSYNHLLGQQGSGYRPARRTARRG